MLHQLQRCVLSCRRSSYVKKLSSRSCACSFETKPCLPVELLADFDGGGLLTLQPQAVHGVGQVDGRLRCHVLDQAHAPVKVRVNAQHLRSSRDRRMLCPEDCVLLFESDIECQAETTVCTEDMAAADARCCRLRPRSCI